VDDFFKQIKPYIFLRELDKVLILPPNKVYKVNETGYALIRYLLQGKKITRFPYLEKDNRADEVHEFFCDLHAFYLGCPPAMDTRKGVERSLYDFGFTRLPILGELAVTYRCNNRCLFCYAYSTGGAACDAAAADATSELSLGDAKTIIRLFKHAAQIPFFSFTGGEPTLRDDLEKMMAYATKLGLQINLITNGTLITAKRARSLYKSGLRTAQVSLESDQAVLHDYLTGAPGAFSKTVQGMKELQAAGISVQTNTTLNRKNAASIALLPDYLKTLGIERFSINLFIPVGRGLQNEELFLPYTETGPTIDKIRHKALVNGQTFFWYSPVPYCHYNPVARGLGNKSCAAMDGLLSVTPTGDVLPCSSYPQPMGNLLKEDFRTIWFSPQAAYFKQKQYAPAECAGCDKFTACQAACPLYWAYAGTDELKNVKAGNKACSCHTQETLSKGLSI
jgi:radical SAM protein with 4Fe4S-binding SPASM domain